MRLEAFSFGIDRAWRIYYEKSEVNLWAWRYTKQPRRAKVFAHLVKPLGPTRLRETQILFPVPCHENHWYGPITYNLQLWKKVLYWMARPFRRRAIQFQYPWDLETGRRCITLFPSQITTMKSRMSVDRRWFSLCTRWETVMPWWSMSLICWL